MKHLALIATMALATPAMADIETSKLPSPPTGPYEYTSQEYLLGSFACAALAVASLTGPTSAVAAGAVLAAGGCVSVMSLGLPFPVPRDSLREPSR